MCTSVSARIYDIPGFTAPLSLKLKYDLRELIKEDPSWDNPISSSLRAKWIENFKLIEELRDVLYVKCPIPEDALRPSVRIWILSDAAPDGGIIISAHAGCERRDGTWSCQLLFARSLLAPNGWTTPKVELHALSSLANMSNILEKALTERWLEIIYSGSDSEIAICWTIYEKARLQVFHRMRVSNIRNKLCIENLHHVDGKSNVADIGTRPDLLIAEQLLPGSDWIRGKAWMKLPVEEAIKIGVIRS